MQFTVSADNLSAPARSDHALHGIPPHRDLSDWGRFACGFSQHGMSWIGTARRGRALPGKARDVIALIPCFAAWLGWAWQGVARQSAARQSAARDVIALIPVFKPRRGAAALGRALPGKARDVIALILVSRGKAEPGGATPSPARYGNARDVQHQQT